ncbi:MAG: ferritin [Methanomicrobiales archaeon]|nr:ferritin [Methanomicrobiales archaeon]
MMKESIEEALNVQMNRELFSSYLYLAMAADFEKKNLRGMGTWMRIQAGEEYAHAMKFYDFIINRGGTVSLRKIDAPPKSWKSPLQAFENAYEHEQKVTHWIHELVDLAISEKDHATAVMLQWFVNEQVEEELNASENVANLKLLGDKGPILMIDHHLGKRKKS